MLKTLMYVRGHHSPRFPYFLCWYEGRVGVTSNLFPDRMTQECFESAIRLFPQEFDIGRNVATKIVTIVLAVPGLVSW